MASDSHIAIRKKAFELAREVMLTNCSIPEIAGRSDVDRHMIGYAHLILRFGTPEEIAAAESGTVALRPLRNIVAARTSPEKKKTFRKKVGVSKDALDQRKMESEVWQKLRDGLIAINNLPAPKDTATIVRKNPMRIEVVNRNLLAVITWIKEFEDEITK